MKQARCRLGFERRVDAAICVSALKAKADSQSSEHGVIATGKHGDSLGGCCVERHIWLLRDPEAMQQHRQLTGYRDDGLVPPLLATSRCQVQTPPSKRGVSPLRSKDVVGAFDQQTS